ncbi:keto-hydroxyglutarate-aldolase/keto-deoxy-phosphogluconate aldolase [Psychromonas sp. B3M02]|uniref:bifunctional 4-hydroxy-2-oxoglutarate aldolase/2-dehydro-3-deoxy-phosphogluconate aldolase n=1 Tax=unclassified Psychromonas TaxID=2614957 RepID=UPI000DEBE69A|nr:bifunctional 4-hydroxy-2-oxoglutarate aldolase/2-dehydro-3-deoxy-phosphogluconate aldolase [Psychromonas sp. B3M02]RBW43076.1 keto-hydroxyglutarate-aldolase/keto-deoxy-phosphogluconate aldolase [Psychromonas sp. B3M02]
MTTLNEKLQSLKVIPVIAIKDANDAVPLGKVLVENGMPCAEITFRTPAAAQSIKNLREAFPEMLIGAGTVLNSETVDLAIDAGVDFIVSPGFNPTTVKYCQQRNMPIIPGVNNPSLVEQAMEMGLTTLKFFPAGPSGGVAMLKSLTAVYPVSFMPTGGVSPANINDYLNINAVLACGGTWMVPADLIDNREWDKIGELVKEAVAALN